MSTPTVGRTVDWDFAATVGRKLVKPAPPTTAYTRDQVVAQLAESARRAEVPVREVTGLDEGAPLNEARIVDRGEWVTAATQSMRIMTGGVNADAAADADADADAEADTGAGSRVARAGGYLTRRVTGAQTGAVLAFVSSGILGQYDPFSPSREPGGHGGGELLLVYPNVIAVERQLRVDPADFRLWVCLHEVTHRVQFQANPWLVGHMSQALAVLTDDAEQDVGTVVSGLGEFVRSRRAEGAGAQGNSDGILGLVRAVQSERQRTALDQLLVLGTLLEGHADHVMDAVGPAVVPSVGTIRRRFNERRSRSQPPLQRLVRALLGFDAKMNQYTRGKAFVDHVVAEVGMHRFNAVWSSADTLPRPSEIDEPGQWIARVL